LKANKNGRRYLLPFLFAFKEQFWFWRKFLIGGINWAQWERTASTALICVDADKKILYDNIKQTYLRRTYGK